MPIRFRCENCQQLMGIARRKAGTTVNCPTCQRPLLVPTEDQVRDDPAPLPAPQPVMPAPAGMAPGAPSLFERDDFDALLRPQQSLALDPARVPELRAAPNVAQPWPQQQESDPAGGLVLSPGRATVLTVVVILLLAVSFGAGLLIGRFYL